MLKILIKLHKLLLNMDQESAKSTKASSSSEPANEANLRANHANNDKLANSRDNAVWEDKNALADLGFPTFEKCPEAPEAIRKQRWLTPTHLKQL